MILQKADTNRYGCKCCGKPIEKGSKFFRDAMQKWRASHTVNICSRCIVRMYVETGIEDKQLILDIKKQISDELKELICDTLEKK